MNRNLPPAPRTIATSSLAWTAIGAVSLVALLILFRPYAGITHDARIYIGQALAALDPSGVGRDLMFMRDEQSRYSIYPFLVRVLVGALGPATAAFSLTLAGLGIWLAGAAILARQFARGPLLWAVLVCILVLSPSYGGLGVFDYGEPFATPRPFAEAAVMAGLAALLAGRRWPALALLALAATIHPILALPGAVAGFFALVWEDRRWLWPAGAALLAIATAVALRLPLADRLLVRIDPVWLQLLIDRNTYLFPTRWAAGDFSRPAVQLVTLAIASFYVPRHVRLLFAGVAVAGLGGLVLAWLFGELIPSVLIAQAQLWRGLWLVALVGNAALALAAIGLWRDGPGARLAMTALALAWICMASPVPGLGFAVAALVLQWSARSGRLVSVNDRGVALAMGAVAVVAVAGCLRIGLALADYLVIGHQAGAPVGWVQALGTDLPRLAAAAVAISVAAKTWKRARARALMSAAAVAVLAACLLIIVAWDARPAYRRALDAREGSAAMTTLLAPIPGEILWVGGDTDAWLLAERANWSSDIQGAGLVFSRPLALAWDARIRSLIELALAGPQSRKPFSGVGHEAPPRPTAAGIVALCARPDAPAAVVIPGAPPASLAAERWRPGAARFFGYNAAGGYAWRRVDAYAVIPCRTAVSALRR